MLKRLSRWISSPPSARKYLQLLRFNLAVLGGAIAIYIMMGVARAIVGHPLEVWNYVFMIGAVAILLACSLFSFHNYRRYQRRDRTR